MATEYKKQPASCTPTRQLWALYALLAFPPETTVTIYWGRLALLACVLFLVTAAIGHRLAVPYGNGAFLLGIGVACVATYGAARWRYAHNTDPFYWFGMWSEVRAWASLNVGVPIVLATLVMVGVMKARHRAALHAPAFEVLIYGSHLIPAPAVGSALADRLFLRLEKTNNRSAKADPTETTVGARIK